MNLASDLAFDFINGVDQKKSKHILRPGKPRKGKTQRIKKDVYFSPLTIIGMYSFMYSITVQSRTLQLAEHPV